MAERGWTSPKARLLLLAAGAALSVLAFMTVGLKGGLAFALELRAVRLAALVEVAVAVAVSTVVFQTITGNRILTPSIMGLDALYSLLQALAVFTLGGLGYAMLPATAKFLGEAGLMALLGTALFLPLLSRRGDIPTLLLAGVVLGVLFRSLSLMVARLIDPNEFAIVQSARYADFNTLDATLLVPCLGLTGLGTLLVWRARHVLDVMALGREAAVGLGVAWRRSATALLVLVGALTAASTALVGPVAFLGLLVVALAERTVGTVRHGPLLLGAMLLAVILLVGGQTILAQLLDNVLTLGIVIEFFGGLAFLILITRRRR